MQKFAWLTEQLTEDSERTRVEEVRLCRIQHELTERSYSSWLKRRPFLT